MDTQKTPGTTTFRGERHRQFRRDIAAAFRVTRAARDNKPVPAPDYISRSLVFGLRGDLSQLSFEDFAADYNAIEGVAEGSLFHLVMALHSNGFSLHASSTEAIAAELAVYYDKATEALQKVTAWPALTFDVIVRRVCTAPRENNGKSIEFTADLVAVEWSKMMYSHGTLSRLDPVESSRLQSLASWLSSRYASWKDLRADVPASMRAICEWITATFGAPSPDLAAIYEGLPQRPKEVKKAPIAYVGLPRLEGSPGLALHRVVASLLGKANAEGIAFESADKFVSESLVTATNNALNWVFGLGLLYLRSTPASAVAEAFRVPACDLMSVEAVCAAARAVPAPRLFGLEHYADYRSLAGGKISAWASNYLNRLAAWHAAVESQPLEPFDLPGALGETFARNLFVGLDFDYPSLCRSLTDLHKAGEHVRSENLPRIMGKLPGAQDRDFEAIERYIDLQVYVTTRLNMLSVRIEADIYLATQAKNADLMARLVACRFYATSYITEDGEQSTRTNFPAWMSPLDKNPGISGGVPNIQSEMRQIESRFNDLLSARADHLARLNQWLKKHDIGYDPARAIANDEHLRLMRAQRYTGGSDALPVVLARRRILSLFLNQLRHCHEDVVRPIAERLIETGVIEKSLLNLFLFNRRRINFYVSYFSRSRHAACELDENVLVKTDWLQWIYGQSRWTWLLAHERPERDLIASAIRLERVAMQIRMHGLPEVDYPAELARPGVDLDLSAAVKINLALETVKADTVARVFNGYYSALNASLALLIRPSFVVRTRFQRAGTNGLLYVPRDREWRIPEGWVAKGSTSSLRDLAEKTLGLSAERREVDVSSSLATLLEEPPTHAVREYMRQVPHEWRFAIGLPAGKAIPGYKINKSVKKEAEKLGRAASPPSLELLGERRYKSLLDLALLPDDRITWGDVTLTAEQVWQQETALKDGKFVIKALSSSMRLFLTVPVRETPRPETEVPRSVDGFWDRAVAIDLGERSIGYAVYDARTGDLIEAPDAPLPAPQIAQLGKLARRHKTTVAPNQKFSAKFDRRMEKARASAVGTLVREINGLCAKYRAFPVLESIVDSRNMDPQVSLAYQAVMKHFLYFGVEEQKKFRERFWYNASSMMHPYLKVRRVDNKTSAKGNVKEKVTISPLNLFPGTSVGPKGTSQRDSHCGRNVFEMLDLIKGNPVFTSHAGEVDLPDGTTLFLERVGQGGRFIPVEDRTYNLSELRSLIRFSMRRPLPGTQGKKKRDTTLSWYKCVIADCRHEHHADQNAAINIGWKFFNVKIAKAA